MLLREAIEQPMASEPQPGAIGTTAHVDIRNVGKTYRSVRGPITALADVSLQIRAGEFVSLLGPSGCGKSTLLKCVAGLEPITAGEIRVAGKPVTLPPENLGVVFQRDILFDWRTVLDNVLITAEFLRLPKRQFVDRARDLLALFGLRDFENRYPWELSGGMRQRVAICRALLTDPKFLLMDEPFGALDALTRDELNVELQDRWLSDKKTILFITHGIVEAAFLSDRVAIMGRNPGRIVEEVSIDLPRPRSLSVRDSTAFTKYTAKIRQVMTDIGALRAR
jgi:NitT/TauT family transport system ATP-binding protein